MRQYFKVQSSYDSVWDVKPKFTHSKFPSQSPHEKEDRYSIQRFFSLPKQSKKNLDPSYKMDLDLWDCVGRVKLIS